MFSRYVASLRLRIISFLLPRWPAVHPQRMSFPDGEERGLKASSRTLEQNDDETWSCCNDDQTLFILMYIAYVAIAFVTWNTLVAKPVRLVTVFLHEMSHAIACWITCGEVDTVHVYENEGGVTKYRGGCRCLITPAGYVGVALWAMVFVILSGGRRTATVAAGIFLVSLLLALCYSPNSTMVKLCVAYALLTAIVLALEWGIEGLTLPIVQLYVLFYGVLVGLYAIQDIYQGTVIRSIQGSDASACHREVCPCCVPKCIGFQWAILAILSQLTGIWIALVEMSEECEDKGWFECLGLMNVDNWFDQDFTNDWKFEGFWRNGP
jgi:Peptidase M50B-like